MRKMVLIANIAMIPVLILLGCKVVVEINGSVILAKAVSGIKIMFTQIAGQQKAYGDDA